MNRNLIRRTLFIFAIVLASTFAIARWPVQLGLDLRGGASLIVRVNVDDVPTTQRRNVVEDTRKILERRINAYGLSEAPIQSYGNRGNELQVQLPGVSEPSRIKNLLQSRAVLEWYSVDEGPYTSMETTPLCNMEAFCPTIGNCFQRGRRKMDSRSGTYWTSSRSFAVVTCGTRV
jgi:preprotein translocase subunit SecD